MSTTNKPNWANLISLIVAAAGCLMAIRATSNLMHQLLPPAWGQDEIVYLALFIGAVSFRLLTSFGTSLYLLAYKVLTGRWYDTKKGY